MERIILGNDILFLFLDSRQDSSGAKIPGTIIFCFTIRALHANPRPSIPN
jgi:hypothetical protein